jgi:2-oxoglutarate dehydrogenase E2 component (dihydrolipoamide succinyltransferase)
MMPPVDDRTAPAQHGTVTLRVPPLAQPDDDAVLAAWHRKPGEQVAAGQALADLETDKAVLEVPAPAGGVLAELLVPEGATVRAGAPLALIEPSPGGVPGESGARPGDDPPEAADTRAAHGQRRMPMARVRRRIAENLLQAQATQALVTTVNEIDVSAVRAMRSRYNTRFGTTRGARIGYLPFFIKASVTALRRFPVVNAMIDGQDVVYREFYDIGVAAATDRGLLVPVLRDADRKSFTELEREIDLIRTRAQSGRIALDELAGGTFTITNGGVFGSLLSTPIVNPPQSAILGMHLIQDRAVVVRGEIVVRPMMYVALTYDHRLIDGSEAVQFLGVVKQCVEDPRHLLAGA